LNTTVDLHAFDVVSGIGDYDKHKACVMSLAVARERIRRGEPIGEATDDWPGFCPVLRSLLTWRNDRPGWPTRQSRKVWAWSILDRLACESTPLAVSVARAERCARVAVTRIAPIRFRMAGMDDHAERLERLPETAGLRALWEAVAEANVETTSGRRARPWTTAANWAAANWAAEKAEAAVWAAEGAARALEEMAWAASARAKAEASEKVKTAALEAAWAAAWERATPEIDRLIEEFLGPMNETGTH
jgi:hypothetical protein